MAAASAINFEDVLQQMRDVRVSIEEDRTSAISRVAALEARIKELEAENASLKGRAPAAPSAAPSDSGRIPPGHNAYTWQHGMERYSCGIQANIPPGHSQYTWAQPMVAPMFDSPVASALLAPPAAAAPAAAAAAPAQAATSAGGIPRMDKFQRTPIARLIQTPQKGKEFIGTNVTVCGWARTVRIQVQHPPLSPAHHPPSASAALRLQLRGGDAWHCVIMTRVCQRFLTQMCRARASSRLWS